METETDREDNDSEYVRLPRKRRKQRRLSRNVDTCVVETPAASANCGNNPQLASKTVKSKMIPLLEKYITLVQFPLNATVIFDGMALLQATTLSGTTYAHLALQLFTCITQGTHTGNRIDFVIDHYPNLSIKNWERNRRTSFVTPAVIQIQHRHQKLPRDWKRFLAAAANIIALVGFLFKEWQLPEYTRLLNGKCVFVCHGSKCSRFTTNDAVTVTEQLIPALSCSAEEADT